MDKPDDDDKTYPVGYKKPPRHTQFKPGHSGNPSGRPKKEKKLLDVLNKEVRAIATLVDPNGRQQKMSMLEAGVRHFVRATAKGDLKAAAMVWKFLMLCHDDSKDHLEALLKQFRAMNTGPADDK
jgi:hypothetical protein